MIDSFCKNPHKPDKLGNTIIHLAAELNYFGMIDELIPSSENLDTVNQRGENCLASVVKSASHVKEHVDIVRMLIVQCKKQNVYLKIYRSMSPYLKAKLKVLETAYSKFPSVRNDITSKRYLDIFGPENCPCSYYGAWSAAKKSYFEKYLTSQPWQTHILDI